MELFVTVLSLGIAAGTASFTLARTKITEPARKWIMAKNKWFGTLFGCPYCLAHWLCGIGMLIYQPRLGDQNIVLDLGMTWLVTVFIAAITFGVIGKSMKALA